MITKMIVALGKVLSLVAGVLAVSLSIAVAEPTKVGFVYLSSPGDFGWTYAHEAGRQMVVDHFGDDVVTTYVEDVPEGPDVVRVIRELAQQGNEIIFTTSFGYMNPTLRVAKEFPDIKFEHTTGFKRAPNMATVNISFHEGRYVQGVVAGLVTKSNKVGYIAAFPVPQVMTGINGFARGLRSVNPDASLSVIWVNTWYDPVKEADAAKVHIAEGADVLAQHTDSPAMLQVAEKSGVHGFGQASDMSAFGPNAQLFAAVNNWGVYYIERIEALRNGTWTTGEGPDYQVGNTWGGLASKLLVLTEFKNMPDSVKVRAQDAVDGIVSGRIKVFGGPLKDNKGNLIIGAGEEIEEQGLWTMDYYVEGVNGEVPN